MFVGLPIYTHDVIEAVVMEEYEEPGELLTSLYAKNSAYSALIGEDVSADWSYYCMNGCNFDELVLNSDGIYVYAAHNNIEYSNDGEDPDDFLENAIESGDLKQEEIEYIQKNKDEVVSDLVQYRNYLLNAMDACKNDPRNAHIEQTVNSTISSNSDDDEMVRAAHE